LVGAAQILPIHCRRLTGKHRFGPCYARSCGHSKNRTNRRRGRNRAGRRHVHELPQKHPARAISECGPPMLK
jgi:hypothetical protein